MVDIFAMEKQLKGEHQQAFSKICIYGSMIPIDIDKYDDRVMNIYDVLMAAQADGKPVEKVIGKDIEKFCKIYYKNHDAGELISNIFKRIYTILRIVFVYTIVMMWIDNEPGTKLMDMKIDLVSIITGLAVGAVIIVLEGIANQKILFKTDKIKNTAYSIGGLIIFIILMVIAFVLIGDKHIMVKALPVMAISGVYIVLYIAVNAIIRYKKNGNVKNLEKEEKKDRKAFDRELSITSDMDDTAIEMAKRHNRINKKRAKRNKPEMTNEEFMEYIRKEHKFYKIVDIGVVVYCVGRVAIEAIVGIGTEDYFFELFVNAVACAVTYIIYHWFSKIIGEVEEAQKRIMASCDERGIDIHEYVKELAVNETNEETVGEEEVEDEVR